MHPKQIMNQIIERINIASEANKGISLSVDEVKVLADEIGDFHYIPVLTNEQVIQLCNEGKLGQSIAKKEFEN
ncbi:hypothetical protein [Acinetobacter indicus]|uniref:hypothetical protein n=1 Tax=Acinetobacter indicus TaxID=756892 RepID=UPI0005F81B91|nr:hypothetical protein [Acinetobacter indicus]KJV37566.1 hypothetical protein VH96_14570 [Acinetobacter indicus]